ncbi:hypothetical protein EJ03DRAFT_70673 [Teratosphaeria nubilosa]|uniref:Uncharacterized protein n=1 Tax=Teratosphaeria nubilosa TaxID=161662 RepID=A0A6G1LMM3_9PEZI|nr:hypothetical protein EJ03DRAFT_70673 [Teratosphaeria nubilosa]
MVSCRWGQLPVSGRRRQCALLPLPQAHSWSCYPSRSKTVEIRWCCQGHLSREAIRLNRVSCISHWTNQAFLRAARTVLKNSKNVCRAGSDNAVSRPIGELVSRWTETRACRTDVALVVVCMRGGFPWKSFRRSRCLQTWRKEGSAHSRDKYGEGGV